MNVIIKCFHENLALYTGVFELAWESLFFTPNKLQHCFCWNCNVCLSAKLSVTLFGWRSGKIAVFKIVLKVNLIIFALFFKLFDIRHHRGLHNTQPEHFTSPVSLKTPTKHVKYYQKSWFFALKLQLNFQKCTSRLTIPPQTLV